jgi:hypothetical protein
MWLLYNGAKRGAGPRRATQAGPPSAMSMQNQFAREERAALELAAHNPDLPAAEVVLSLLSGLTQLRELLTMRLHQDVEMQFGVDSMVAPMSRSQEVKQVRTAGLEIDAYAALVVDDEVTGGGYVDHPGEWFRHWMIQLLLSDGRELASNDRADPYGGLSDKGRRLRFASLLQQAIPESVKTPPLLFLLFPLSVRIVAAVAFADALRAQKLRAEQVDLLSAIDDCHECDGRVLGNDERCRTCGNPLWTFAWLRAD